MIEHVEAATDDAAANRLAMRIILVTVLVLVVAAVIVVAFGPPALGILGLIATLVIFAVMLAFTAGN